MGNFEEADAGEIGELNMGKGKCGVGGPGFAAHLEESGVGGPAGSRPGWAGVKPGEHGADAGVYFHMYTRFKYVAKRDQTSSLAKPSIISQTSCPRK